LVMSAWVVLFISQVLMIRTMRVKTHQRSGMAAIALAIAIFVIGLWTGVASAQRGGGVPGIPPLSFLIVPVGDVLVFAVLFAAAVYYRRNPANHKRLMLLTVINFLPPAIGRFPGGMTEAFGPLWFYGVPGALTIFLLAADTWRNRKLNKVFLAASIFLIASQWIRLAVAGGEPWLAIARWMTGVS
ncbi:MAG: hypothetical protein LC730_04835, partial [Acidobacteria bacterium]|nr:hypothetical protein [Acidobacteriota bacterium]